MKPCQFLLALLCAGMLLAQDPGGRPRPRAESMHAESRLIARAGIELLTYETEADVEKLEQLLVAGRAAVARAGEFTMHYFRSTLDGSVQPYGFRLPRNYDSAAKFPLLVQLHGIGPKSLAGLRTKWRGMGVKEWIDPFAPVIVAQPMGRGNTFYQGMGEQDVLEVVEDVSRRYSVDPDRVFIMGHSMGGAGSWLVGLHHPDRFGGITPVDAAMGFRDAVDNPSALPAWLVPQVAAFRPDNLFPNARNVPVFMKNAGAGIQKNSTKFSDGVVAAGGFATMESFPGMPHHFAPQFSYAAFMGEATLRPIERQPREVRFYTTTLRYNRAYWVSLDRLERSPAESRVVATYDDGLPKPVPGRRDQPRLPARPATLRRAGDPDGGWSGRLLRAAARRAASRKGGREMARGGGARFVGQAPRLAGTGRGCIQWSVPRGLWGRRPAARPGVRNPPSQLVIQAEFPLKAAARVTADDIAGSNLILFGTPKTNPVLARLAPKLPASLLQAAENGNAVVFIHPNPE
ncbi:MAG TPA: alpha/beta hydrolase-fold protein, partial [Opitutaceae bacterium]|nr:alpha/beta hydrolase-fold protein [Opitutaceae bacterium]